MKTIIIVYALILLSISGCGSDSQNHKAKQKVFQGGLIVRSPAPADWSFLSKEIPVVKKYDPDSQDPWQNDFRSRNLTTLDLAQSSEDLMYASFDSRTIWPAADKMPLNFNWQKIMEMAKNPGLGIRALHQQGVTGSGVGIAIIDQPLLLDHQEYREQLKFYEEINIDSQEQSSMHGSAVASIAVGKTVGVAPGADLYYIGAWPGSWNNSTNEFNYNFGYYAQAIRRILEINIGLPESGKIRVIAMQIGWESSQDGYEDINAAVEEAKAAGVFVISSSLEQTFGLAFHGLGRNPLGDPDDFSSYSSGLFWSRQFFNKKMSLTQRLLVPMDARTTASPTGVEHYAYYRSGGWSWSIPYLAASYALVAQVKPEITYDQFWKLALETGRTIQLEHEGSAYALGVIFDPQALIRVLQK